MSEAECLVDEEFLPIYYEAAQVMEHNHVPFLLGGGLMVSHYGRGRKTKDIDFFIRPADKNRAMNALAAAGFFTTETEKAWLLKAEKDGAPLDLIVHSGGMDDVDEECFAHARTIRLGGYPFPGFGPEDLLLRKIYAWQEGRPDWWDALSMVTGEVDIDWEYVLRRIPAQNPGRALSFFLFAHAYFPEERIPWKIILRAGAPFFCENKPLPHGPQIRRP